GHTGLCIWRPCGAGERTVPNVILSERSESKDLFIESAKADTFVFLFLFFYSLFSIKNGDSPRGGFAALGQSPP
ncbi:MAG: hypothetical protein ACOCXX_05610, partial [Planctomycetota bacterium]